MSFFDIIFNDSSDYIGFIPIIRRKSDNFRVVRYVKRNEIKKFIETEFNKSDRYDYYISANCFTKMTRNSALLSFNNIVLDIDAHAVPPDQCGIPPDAQNEIQDFVFRLKSYPGIPQPTVIHYTGRGVHLWYSIEQISAKYTTKYNKAVGALVNVVQSILDDNCYEYIELDSGASCKQSGLFRLFDTVNTKTKTNTHAEITGRQYLIDDILQMLDDYTPNITPTTPNSKPIKHADSNYINLHRARLNVLQAVAEREKTPGKRNTVLWLAYNALIQMQNGTDAETNLKKINNLFYEPLKPSEVNAIMRSINKKPKYYDFITNQRFCEMLSITPDFYFQHSNPQKRDRKQKADAKQAKRERMIKDLQNGMKQKDVATKYNVGIATVKRLCADMKKTFSDKSAC